MKLAINSLTVEPKTAANASEFSKILVLEE